MHSCTVCSNYPLPISLFIKVGYYFYHAPESTCMVCNANGLVISYFLVTFSRPRLAFRGYEVETIVLQDTSASISAYTKWVMLQLTVD